MHACVRVCARACMHACMHASERASTRTRATELVTVVGVADGAGGKQPPMHFGLHRRRVGLRRHLQPVVPRALWCSHAPRTRGAFPSSAWWTVRSGAGGRVSMRLPARARDLLHVLCLGGRPRTRVLCGVQGTASVVTCAFSHPLCRPLTGTRTGSWALGRHVPRVRQRRVPQDADAAFPGVRQVQGRGLLQQGVSGAPPRTHMQRAAPEPAPAHTDPLLRACPAPLPVTRPRRGRPGTSARARRGKARRRPR